METGIDCSRAVPSALRGCVALVLVWGAFASPVRADVARSARVSAPAALAGGSCLCEQDRTALLELREQVARAPTVAEARELAAASTREARLALGRARHFVWFDRGALDSAYERLQGYESRVRQAPTPQAVADEFAALLLGGAGPAQPQLGPGVSAATTSCTYSTGEVIAIILGLILGVIPGLILLILLC